ARYYTPKDRSIQTTGITPDIIVKAGVKVEEESHPVIREKDLKKHLENDNGEEQKEEDKTDTDINEDKEPDSNQESDKESEAPTDSAEDKDIQLQRAVDLLKSWKVFRTLPKAS
ncbi:MAG: hypothetical protein JSU99_10515, partial [Nitrospiraceae bacterium]